MADFSLYGKTVRALGVRGMSRLLCDRLLSFNQVFILQTSLLSVSAPHPHRMQFSLSRVEEGDWTEILRQAHCVDTESRREIFARAMFFKNGFKNCYALRSKTGLIAHIQWVVFPEENDLIGTHYRGHFMPLDRGEIMIENAFTFPRFRGLGLYAYGTRGLMDLGRQQEYKKASSYVRSEKVASLNELIRLGFSFKRVVREYKVLGFTRRALGDRNSCPGGNAARQRNAFAGASPAGEEKEPERTVDKIRGCNDECR
ncbi:MAG: hypothetical protein P4L43_01755 [Syntrophobacteraceae bacterium]|nr:hypothetical protein [Syntrophobacteraceae bacterium]